MARAGEQGKGETPAHVVVVRVEEPVAVPTGCTEYDNLKCSDSSDSTVNGMLRLGCKILLPKEA